MGQQTIQPASRIWLPVFINKVSSAHSRTPAHFPLVSGRLRATAAVREPHKRPHGRPSWKYPSGLLSERCADPCPKRKDLTGVHVVFASRWQLEILWPPRTGHSTHCPVPCVPLSQPGSWISPASVPNSAHGLPEGGPTNYGRGHGRGHGRGGEWPSDNLVFAWSHNSFHAF